MPAEEHGFIRALSDRYQGWFTPVGRVVLWTVLATGFLLLGGLVTSLILFFSFAFCALAAGVLVGLPFRPRVSLTRLLPPPVSAGDTLRYRVRVHNTGRFSVRHLTVEERGLPPQLRRVGEPPVLDVIPLFETFADLQAEIAAAAAGWIARLGGARGARG